MFHSNTEQLIDYWRQRRGNAAVPQRSAIDPTDFAQLLPQVVILGRRGPGQYHFRLAGGFVSDLHGRGLRSEDLMRIWRLDDRTQVQLALESIRRRSAPLVIETEAEALSDSPGLMSLEIVLMPLAGVNGEVDRMLGLYQPTSPAAALRGHPIRPFKLNAIRTVGDDGEGQLPQLRLAAVNGRSIG